MQNKIPECDADSDAFESNKFGERKKRERIDVAERLGTS